MAGADRYTSEGQSDQGRDSIHDWNATIVQR
jgi:hypothetical protein